MDEKVRHAIDVWNKATRLAAMCHAHYSHQLAVALDRKIMAELAQHEENSGNTLIVLP